MRKFCLLVSLGFCFLVIGCDLCNAQRVRRVFGSSCLNCRVTQIASGAPITTTTEPVVVEQTTQQIVETTQSFRPITGISSKGSSCTGVGCGAGPIRSIRSRAGVSRGARDRWTPFRNVFGRAPERIQSRSARRSRELGCITGKCFS